MIEVVVNDRLGKKVRVKCNPDDTIGDLKKLLAAQIGTRPEKIRLQKWYTVFKDHITLEDYEIHDSMNLEMCPLHKYFEPGASITTLRHGTSDSRQAGDHEFYAGRHFCVPFR